MAPNFNSSSVSEEQHPVLVTEASGLQRTVSTSDESLSSFWKTQISTYKHVGLPNLSSRRKQIPALHVEQYALGEDICRLLNSCQDLGLVSPVRVAQAALVKALSFYVGTNDILTGFLPTNSASPLPAHTLVQPNLTWTQLTQVIEETYQSTSNHGYPSLAILRQFLQLNDQQTLFAAIFLAFESSNTVTLNDLNLWGSSIALQLAKNGTAFALSLHYDISNIHPTVAQSFVQSVASTMKAMLHNPSNLSSISPSTYLPSTLLSSYEPAEADHNDSLVMEALHLMAMQRPDAIAVEWYHDVDVDAVRDSITFLELDQKSNQLANYLISSGVKIEDKVAVCGPRNLDFYVAFLGILKAGACYVPVAPDLPEERKNFIVADSQASLVLLPSSEMTGFGAKGIEMSNPAVRQMVAKCSKTDPKLASLDSLAYMLYTSGTTGVPKGCLITHRGLTAFIHEAAGIMGKVPTSNTDKYLGLASIAFDVHIAEILLPWQLGFRSTNAPRNLLLEDLQHAILSMGVTHCSLVPSLLDATLGSAEGPLPLKVITSGGEKITDGILDRWGGHPDYLLVNFYGPTEVSIGCAGKIVDKTDCTENIGKAFSTCRAYVVDENMNIVPKNTPGELVVEGKMVGRGYHNRPDLLNSAFLEWPRPGCCAYRTGDLVRMMPDFSLEIIGRIDTQIKVHGVRIESEGISHVIRLAVAKHERIEVTTVLSKHPGIELGGQQIVSFISVDDHASVAARNSTKASILTSAACKRLVRRSKAACDKELASYMRPKHIIPVDFLPLTSNAKIDTKALVSLFQSTPPSILSSLDDPALSKQHDESSLRETLANYRHIDLPNLSNSRFPTQSPHFSTAPIPLPSLKLQSFVSQLGISGVDILAQAAVARCITSYTGELDVLCGVSDTIASTILPIRIHPTPSTTWVAVLNQLDSLNANFDGHTPSVSAVKKALQLSENTTPFLAVCIVDKSSSLAGHGLDLLKNLGTSFAWQVEMRDGVTTVMSLSNTAVLSASVAQLLTEQVAEFIGLIVRDANAQFVSTHTLSQHLLSVHEPIDVRIDKGEMVTDTLQRRRLERPNAIAVEWYGSLSPIVEPDTLTYRELDERSNQFARLLIARGLKLEDKVGVCGPRDLLFHIAFAGILKAGGCYVPIDPDLPAERKMFIASDSGALFVVAAPDQAQLFGDKALAIPYARLQQELVEYENSYVSVASPDSLAYLLYTSGTSGTPKGCLITHRGLSAAVGNLCGSWENTVDTNTDKHLGIASIAFDVHVGEMVGAWKFGYRICTAHRSELLENLAQAIEVIGITHAVLVPSLMEAVILPIKHDLPLKFIGSGGEKLSDAVIEWWATKRGVQLTNFYGPSETSIGVSAHTMRYNDVRANIGKTVPGCSSYVVDENMKPVLRGAAGELIVEGDLVGRGYHGRPDLTQKSFAKWPHADSWSYRTGDLVRMMPDSSLEILGRIDSQIKLRGVRIEAEGISNTLRLASTETTIEVATLLARHPEIGVDQLVSFASTGRELSATERANVQPTLAKEATKLLEILHAASNRELAVYMRPSHIVPISHLPLTNNGKVDNKMLIALFQSSSLADLAGLKDDPSRESRPPTTIELSVIQVLTHHTQIPQSSLGPTSNLFECGLDSLRLVAFSADLREIFDHVPPVAAIMADPTVEAIATSLEHPNSHARAPQSHENVIDRFAEDHREEVQEVFAHSEIEVILPSFPVQEGVLYQSLQGSSAAYVQHILLRCHDDIEVERLRLAWQATLVHHSILRTVFVSNKALSQVVLRTEQCVLPWSEHSAQTENFAEWFDSSQAEVIARDICDDIKTPLHRLRLYTTATSRYFSLSIHHSIYDGTALPLLLKSVENLYHGIVPAPEISSAPILQYIGSTDMEKARSFWQDRFAGFDFQANQYRSPTGREARLATHKLSTNLAALETVAAAMQVTLQGLFLSIFGALVGREFYDSSDVSIGVIRAGRSLPVDGIDLAILPLVTVVPMRLNLKHTSPSSLARSVQKDVVSMLPFEHVPLGKVQRWVNEGRSMFELVFSYRVSRPELTTSSLWDLVENAPPQPDFILAAEVVADPSQNSISLQAVFTEKDLDPASVDGLLRQFDSMVASIVEGTPVSFSGPAIGHNNQNAVNGHDLPHIITPENPALERKLSALISSFLGIKSKNIPPTSSLISFGLDSLKAVALSRHLKEHGVTTPAAELMRAPTIRGIIQSNSSLLTSTTREREAEDLLSERRGVLENLLHTQNLQFDEEDSVQLYPATGLQSGMLTQTIQSEGRLYVHAFPLRLRSGTQLQKLQQAWYETLKALEILRTSFCFADDIGSWAQVVHTKEHFDWTETRVPHDQSTADAVLSWTSSLSLYNEDQFNLPPIRFRVFHSDSSIPPLLVVVMHHAIYDGNSLGILLDHVQNVYQNQSTEPALAFSQIVAPILFQEEHGAEYWTSVLSDFTPLSFPRLENHDMSGSWKAERSLNVAISATERMCRRLEITMQSAGQAAWARTLAEMQHSDDVVFGQVISGRSIGDVENVIGPVLNTIPCRVKMSPSISNKALAKNIHKANLEALSWQHASLRSIQQALGVTEIYDSLFLFQKTENDPRGGLWSLEEFTSATIHSQYAINIELHQTKKGLHVVGACRRDVMSEEAFHKVLSQFEDFLRQLVDRPNDPVLRNDHVTSPQSNQQATRSSTPSTDSTLPVDFPEPIAKSSTTHTKLLEILAAVARVPQDVITPLSSLAALGIDSISAIQLAAKCRRAGLLLAASDLAKCRTVGDMVMIVLQKQRISKPTNIPTIEEKLPKAPENAPLTESRSSVLDRLQLIERVVPASAGMEWLIGAWQRSHQSRFQHVFAFKSSQYLKGNQMHRAWNKLVQRHEILRTTFAPAAPDSSDGVALVTFESFESPWVERFVDGDRKDSEVVSETMLEWVSEPPSTRFPPIRAGMLYSRQASFLVLQLHHFQYDAWSLQLLVKDLCDLYNNIPLSSPINHLPFLSACTSPRSRPEQRAYWMNAFNLSQPKHFPHFNTSPLTQPERTNYVRRDAIPGASYLAQKARSVAVSLQAAFLAAWALVQANSTGSDEATFGLWNSGRTADVKDIEFLATPSMNVLPFQVQLRNQSGKPSSEELTVEVQEALRKRSWVIEQTRLVDVHKWVNAADRPLNNVFVNILALPGMQNIGLQAGHQDMDHASAMLLEPVEVSYTIPPTIKEEGRPTMAELGITKLIQDDLFIEIGFDARSDCVFFAVECNPTILSAQQASELTDKWILEVLRILG